MKKKTIVFLCLSLIFLVSIPACFSSSLSTGIICIGLCALFAFFTYYSFRMSKADAVAVDNPLSSSTPKINLSDLDTAQHDTVNTTNTKDTALLNSNPAQHQNKYLFVPIKITGVTFDNDDGTSRQLILRKLNFHDSPFDEYADVEIRQYEFKGQPAYGVYANNIQIGNIPADLVPFLQENIDRIESISYIDVYGGGSRNGKPISYGCKITLRFLKDNPPVNIPNSLKLND